MLRAILQKDIPQLCALEIATQQTPWTREVFEKCFQAQGRGWVVTQSVDNIIGFILFLSQGEECHILNICVDPKQQRNGYGTQLLSSALNEAAEVGAKIAYLEVRRSNANAISLYKKMGFTQIGERKNYYTIPESKGHEDAWVFARKIFGVNALARR